MGKPIHEIVASGGIYIGMKFSELYESNEEVLKKRAKHIYTLLHQGIIDWETENGWVKVKYTLPSKVDFSVIQLRDGKNYSCIELPEEEDNDITYVNLETNQPINGQYGPYDDDNELLRLLFNKFKKFGVVLLDWSFFAPYPGYDFVTAISQVMGIRTDYDDNDIQDYINEGDKSVNIDLTPAQKKKAKSIYAALKSGIFQVADSKVKYKLPDDFFIDIGEFTGKILALPDNPRQLEFPVNLYLIKDNGEEVLIQQHNQNLYKVFTTKIMKRFSQFDITLVF